MRQKRCWPFVPSCLIAGRISGRRGGDGDGAFRFCGFTAGTESTAPPLTSPTATHASCTGFHDAGLASPTLASAASVSELPPLSHLKQCHAVSSSKMLTGGRESRPLRRSAPHAGHDVNILPRTSTPNAAATVGMWSVSSRSVIAQPRRVARACLAAPDHDSRILCRRSTVKRCNHATFWVQAPFFQRTNSAYNHRVRAHPKSDELVNSDARTKLSSASMAVTYCTIVS